MIDEASAKFHLQTVYAQSDRTQEYEKEREDLYEQKEQALIAGDLERVRELLAAEKKLEKKIEKEEELKTHFPNIVQYCIDKGYDPSKECIPVVPAQHYFMGGIKVDHESRTTMDNLYAIGETACNGVHGRNRLASNSLLESLVFAKRAALDITENAVVKPTQDEITYFDTFDAEKYADESEIDGEYAELVNKKIEEADKAYEESQKKNYA